MTEAIDELLSQHSVCTFRFYAQHAGVPASEAKEAFQTYAEERQGKVHVVHLLGGVLKSAGVDGALQYQLVPDDKLEAAKELFEPVTACHPYSLHAQPATSGEPLFILNHTQDRKLYDKLEQGAANCLLDNRWSAVKCPAATVKPRAPVRKAAPPPAPPPPAPKPPARASPPQPPAASGRGASSSGAKAPAASKQPAPKAPAEKAADMPELEADEDEASGSQGAAKGGKEKAASSGAGKKKAASGATKQGGFAALFAAPKAPAKAPPAKTPPAAASDAPTHESRAPLGDASGNTSADSLSEAGAAASKADPPAAEEEEEDEEMDEEDEEALSPISKRKLAEARSRKEGKRPAIEDEDEEDGERKRPRSLHTPPGDKEADDELAEAAPSAPRTYIVKERVKEERTYQDARGYLVCEEVWVEREVEREAPAVAPRSSTAVLAPKPAPRPLVQPRKGQPRGLDSEDAEVLASKAEKKEKGKGKAAAAPQKVMTGASSILGFFGKK